MITPERSHELLCTYAATRCVTAFRELVAGWTGMVYSTALRVARGQETLAEDVTQTVFFRLAAAPEKVKDARALGAWLHAAATGTALDALRLEARRRKREETSQLLMLTPFTPAMDAGDVRHDLAAEIDGALSKLPTQDSQILVMRFWQEQDWHSIGRSFGMSDDAAQKRMNRAFERLRRILARRGIKSTTGLLSAVLAGTIPHDLPAATMLRIVSSTQVHAATTTAFATTAAMTTKTKVAIAAALLLAVTAPYVYQQQRIASLRKEVRSQRPGGLLPVNHTPAGTALAKERPSAGLPAKLPAFTAPPSPGITGPSDPVLDEAGSVDYDALILGQVEEKLAALRKRLSLTPEQEPKIATALKYGQAKTKVLDNDTKVIRATVEDKMKMQHVIRASLTADQEREYESFLAEEIANAAEAVANRELSTLQSITTLSLEQKDQAFLAFSEIAAKESMEDLPEPGSDPASTKETVDARWADRREALRSILTPEQMAIYQQAGNPFKGNTGG